MRKRPLILTVLTVAGLAAVQLPGASPAMAATVTIQDTQAGTGINQVEYTGSSWTRCGGCGPATDDASFYYGYTVGDSFTLRFDGTQIAVWGPTDNGGGIADVTVDGAAAGTADFQATDGTPADTQVWTSAVLPAGEHTVVFTISSATNSGSNVVLLDKATVTTDVLSTGPQLPPDPSAHKPNPDKLIGAGVEDPYEFDAWLGRNLQVWQTWNNYPAWSTMENVPPIHQYFTGEGPAPFDKKFPGRVEMGQPLFAADETTANCATGGDDAHYTAVAQAMEDLGEGDAIIRLGWEQNGDWFWWHATTANDAQWASCFRHAYTAFKNVDKRFVIEWNANKGTDMANYDSRGNWPGDNYVDAVGVDFYDQYPPYPDQAAWDADYNSTQNGGSPTGIGSWIAFAKAHDKKIDFPEWGLNGQNDPTRPDNDLFIDDMAKTFDKLGAQLLEQSYFDLQAGAPCNFEIHIDNCNPLATAAYLKDFGTK